MVFLKFAIQSQLRSCNAADSGGVQEVDKWLP